MARSYEEIRSAAYQQAADAVERQYGVRKKTDEEQLGQINAAIDREAGAATESYQNRINGAADEFQSLYDRNALQEMISRRQVEESMANMGLTDSGLNRTQQTAIALQRGNADAATSKQQRDYVTKAQEAIDTIRASAASQKAQQAATTRKATDDWYVNAMAGAEQSSAQSAAAQYQAEQEYAAQIEAAQIEAAAKERAARIEAQQKAISDNSAARNKYAQALITSGETEDRAWASAYARYGADDEAGTVYYRAYNAALNNGYSAGAARAAAQAAQNGQNPDDAAALYAAKENIGDKTFYTGTNILTALFGGKRKFTGATAGSGSRSNQGYRSLYDSTLSELGKDKTYQAANKNVQQYMIALAVGKSIGTAAKGDRSSGLKMLEDLKTKLSDNQYLAAAEAAGLYSAGSSASGNRRRTGAQE